MITLTLVFLAVTVTLLLFSGAMVSGDTLKKMTDMLHIHRKKAVQLILVDCVVWGLASVGLVALVGSLL